MNHLLQGRSRVFKIGTDVKFALAMFLSIVIAVAMQVCYMTHIPKGGNQEDYIIDPYYYMHLGEVVVRQSSLGQGSIYALSEDYEPNGESRGIIYLNAVLYQLLPSWSCLPLFFGAIYLSLFYILYRLHLFNATLLLFPFYALYLDIFVPSKEAFLFIGFVLLLIGFLRSHLWPLGILGLLLMLIARPPAAAIFLIALFARYCMRGRILRYLFLIGIGILYLTVVRKELFQLGKTEQDIFSIIGADTYITFCKVGPLSVCVSTINTFELILAQRLLTLLLLPEKWVWNVIQLFLEDYGRMTIFIVYNRLSLIIHMVLAGIVVVKNKTPAPCARNVRVLMLCFGSMYLVTYGTLVYYQPTRQTIVVVSLILLTLSMTSEKNKGICLAT